MAEEGKGWFYGIAFPTIIEDGGIGGGTDEYSCSWRFSWWLLFEIVILVGRFDFHEWMGKDIDRTY